MSSINSYSFELPSREMMLWDLLENDFFQFLNRSARKRENSSGALVPLRSCIREIIKVYLKEK